VQFVELVVLRLVLLVGLPLVACVLIFGPARVEQSLVRAWNWFWGRRYEPERLLRLTVRQQEQLVASRRLQAQRAEAMLADSTAVLQKSETDIANLDKKAERLALTGDDLGARAALLKLHLERYQAAKLLEQWRVAQHKNAEIRRELYGAELQLRQYEVGRELFLSQAADLRTIKEQLAMARDFDPFHSIADWRTTRASDGALSVPASVSLALPPAEPDPELIEQQLLNLKSKGEQS